MVNRSIILPQYDIICYVPIVYDKCRFVKFRSGTLGKDAQVDCVYLTLTNQPLRIASLDED